MFELGSPRHDIGSLVVEVVSFLSHRERGAMVYLHGREYER